MRVLQLIKTADGATWAYRQIKVLLEQGIQVAVCMPKGKMWDKYLAEGIKVYELNYTVNPVKQAYAFREFKKAVNDFKPDLIHSHFVITTLFVRLYRLFNSLHIPIVFQVPGPLHLEHFIFRNADLLTSNKYDYWVASCNWTKNKYTSSGISEKKVFLSYYGTDLTFVKKHRKGKLRSELGLKDNDFIVGMVAFMYPPKPYIGQKNGIKGHEDFFIGVSECIKENNKIKAIVVGGAWNGAVAYEQKLINMGRELCGDNIYFLGSRNDVPELYADIDLVVHPSYSENLGGAAESLLLEVPTIATNVGGFPDIVVDNETGYLINPGAPNEIAESIKKSFTDYDKIKRMALAGGEKVKSIMDVNKTGKEVFEIYNQILGTTKVGKA
ncbi:glycosyltransferase family 4 protein [Pontibacter sp. Tf4]|uniref:glycosyltransferase family 4 protein n=1 Tax=Pontibacter sp. Tf4 TaxID=2761620 RepID=UPI0016236397|nr:glycosyltransferase family 4 protein [Pontibacter sp. Tf4]MBB6612714.1 glycosyltransferase family 4 protein [Pontibacter sp. Tf4]